MDEYYVCTKILKYLLKVQGHPSMGNDDSTSYKY